MDDCIFCKIVAGQIPGFKVYEDADTVAFLDVMPRSVGMCIVVPKRHYNRFDQDMDSSSKVFDTALLVAEKVAKALNPQAVFFSSLEAQVHHFHVRVYPVNEGAIPLVENKPIEVDQNQLISLSEKIRSAEVPWRRKEKVVEVVREVKVEREPERPKDAPEKSRSLWVKKTLDLP